MVLIGQEVSTVFSKELIDCDDGDCTSSDGESQDSVVSSDQEILESGSNMRGSFN